jgi:hypothetical protein
MLSTSIGTLVAKQPWTNLAGGCYARKRDVRLSKFALVPYFIRNFRIAQTAFKRSSS